MSDNFGEIVSLWRVRCILMREEIDQLINDQCCLSFGKVTSVKGEEMKEVVLVQGAKKYSSSI